MAVAFTELTAANIASSADASTYTSGSVTLTAGRLYLYGISNDMASGPSAPTAIATTGGALSFTSVDSNLAITTNAAAISLWRCLPGSNVTDTIVISAATSIGCNAILVEVTGMVTSGTNGSGAIVQTKNNGSNTQVTTQTVTLNSNLVSGNARFSCGVSTGVNTAGKPSVTSGTWTSSTTTQHHANPTDEFMAAWDTAPAITDTSAIWTPGGTNRVASIICEIGLPVSTGTFSAGVILT